MRLIDADAIPWTDLNDNPNSKIRVLITFADKVNKMPTVEGRKTGKWINNIHDIPICDQCGYMTPYDRAIDDYEYGNYCPNCGADMREQP